MMPILLIKCEEEKCHNLSRDGIQEGFAQKLTIKEVEAVRRNKYYDILNIFQSENQVKKVFQWYMQLKNMSEMVQNT
jgi:hypothetical protein